MQRNPALVLAALLLSLACDPASSPDGGPSAPDAGLWRDAGPPADAGPPTEGCAPPCHAWARLSEGPSEEDEIDAVAVDQDGNVYISGKFEDRLRIEGWPDELVSAGRADIMVAKISPEGETLWVRHFGGPGEDNVFDADCDAEGNVYLSGYFAGEVDFGGVTLASSGVTDLDMMVLRMTPEGDTEWAVRAGGSGADGGNEIEVGASGALAVLAGTESDFDADGVHFEPTPGQDAVLLSMNPETGAFEWGRRLAGPGLSRAKALAIDDSDNIYMGGDYRGVVTVEAPNRSETFEPAQALDAFLSAWTPSGDLRWTHTWGGEGLDLCKAVVAAETGELFLVGYFSGEAAFAGEVLHAVEHDMFVWSLNSDGSTRWLNHISAPNNLTGSEATSAPDGGVIFGFRIRRDVTLTSAAGAPTRVEMPDSGSGWPLLVSYDAEGQLGFTLMPTESSDANLDEIARSGRRLYVDMPIFAGDYRVGPDERSSNGTKDALIVAVDL